MNRSCPGVRWKIPFVLVDAVLYYATARVTIKLTDSRNATVLLDKIRDAIDDGCKLKVMQSVPHVVLLDRMYYEKELRPLLTRWLVLWLMQTRIKEVSEETAVEYLMHGPKMTT